MNDEIKTSLLISTYNWPEALDLVLKSVIAQTVLPDEVLLADDGSSEETKKLIKKYQEKSRFPIQHIWHEDKGFRRTVILNKAIAKAKGNYIIQLDGDCILHKNFVEDHKKNTNKNTFLFGSRVNIQESFLAELFNKKQVSFPFFTKGIKKRTRNLHLAVFNKLYLPKNELSGKLRGCNLSFWKKDFLKINGYNEAMTGWGKEDSEMAIRLLNSGVKGKRLRYAGIIYHIWHHIKSKERYNINAEIEKKALTEKLTWCENGISKYL